MSIHSLWQDSAQPENRICFELEKIGLDFRACSNEGGATYGVAVGAMVDVVLAPQTYCARATFSCPDLAVIGFWAIDANNYRFQSLGLLVETVCSEIFLGSASRFERGYARF